MNNNRLFYFLHILAGYNVRTSVDKIENLEKPTVTLDDQFECVFKILVVLCSNLENLKDLTSTIT